MPAITAAVQRCLAHQLIHLHRAVSRKDEAVPQGLSDDQAAFLESAQVHPCATQVVEDAMMYTLYTMTAYCPITRRWWLVKKRYSEYHAFRKQLDALWVHCELKMKADPLTPMLRSIMKMPFPRRVYNGDSVYIIKERIRVLETFLRKLMAIHAECFYYAYQKLKLDEPLSPTFHAFHSLLQTFLGVPSDMLDLRAMQRMLNHTLDKPHGVDADEACSICLSTFDETEGEAIVQLSCSHLYHRDCVVSWLVAKKSCPLCREDVDSGSVL
ncbi:hypothetical protein SDRG_02453 [Saprolegnia diclina VS20]|uniref:RING-type domain-containing protein n=1 Tax=Saprolegnia diclina (strain VS20) TaxID=1156394 RepID=T0R2N5_SAPDV|nr:hypothetical protein SDRG_02453 [Saprolegnia diclina VS20]EQC40565.1 hypothetical protein SDRG_02453 [Saprolegnia diclina VS20]|eukprot:XP_008606264.1 hypothetical protein SDRG_02453 [Saprolegnia diclina VS20]